MELFKCEPYRVRLTPKACARRYREAKATGQTTMRGTELALCRGCAVGRSHARKSDSGVELSDVEARPGKDMKNYSEKVCPCGATFRRKGPAQKYCLPDCEARKKAQKAAPPPERGCEQCSAPFTPSKQAQRFCPGGVCSAKWHSANRSKAKPPRAPAPAPAAAPVEPVTVQVATPLGPARYPVPAAPPPSRKPRPGVLVIREVDEGLARDAVMDAIGESPDSFAGLSVAALPVLQHHVAKAIARARRDYPGEA